MGTASRTRSVTSSRRKLRISADLSRQKISTYVVFCAASAWGLGSLFKWFKSLANLLLPYFLRNLSLYLINPPFPGKNLQKQKITDKIFTGMKIFQKNMLKMRLLAFTWLTLTDMEFNLLKQKTTSHVLAG